MAYVCICRLGAALCWLVGIILWVEYRFGVALLARNDDDASTGTAAVVLIYLGILLWLTGDLASVRLRVARLERRLWDAEGKGD